MFNDDKESAATEEERVVEAAPSEDETISKLQAEIDEQKTKNLLLLAEMENTRKRMQREKIEMNRFSVENVIADFLAPIDQMEQALSFAGTMSGEVKNWATGFQMILGQFKEVLSQNGITAYKSEGEQFSPHKHEAVETEVSDNHPEGYILKEFVKGYMSGDRVVRVARVKIAKKPAQIETQEEDISAPEMHPDES